jgi:hypothetical protein
VAEQEFLRIFFSYFIAGCFSPFSRKAAALPAW